MIIQKYMMNGLHIITYLKLLQKLDQKKELLKANYVLIENQPSMVNPVMKSISNALYDF